MSTRSRLFALLAATALTPVLCVPWPRPVLAAAETSTRDRSDQYVQDAVKEIQAGRNAAAVIQLRNALQRDPDNRQARLLLGELYLKGGDAKEAEKELRRAHDLAPDDRSETLLGEALDRLLQYNDVLAVVGEDAATPEARHDKLLLRGKAKLALGHADEAEALLHRALEAQPDASDARFQLVRVAIDRGTMDRAEAELDTLLTSKPDLLEGWLLKTDLLVERSRFEEAAQAVNRALVLKPADPRALLSRARIGLLIGRPADAERDAGQVLKRNPNDVRATYLLTMAAYARSDFTAADQLFVTIEDKMRDFPPAMLLGALIRLQTSHFVQAEDALVRLIAVRPTEGEPKRLLAGLLLRQGNAGRAIEILEPWARQTPGDGDAQRLLASAYLRSGDFEKATGAFERLAANPGQPEGARDRATLRLLGHGLDADGHAMPKTGIGEPDDLTRGIAVVIDYLRAGDIAAATADVTKLQERFKNNPVLINLDGTIRMAAGDFTGARARFEAALAALPDFPPALDNLNRLDLGDGKPDAVDQRLTEALARHPDSEPLALRLSQRMIDEKRFDPALALLEARVKAAPTSIPLRQALLAGYFKAGRTDAAAQSARDLLAITPPTPPLAELAGRALLQANQPEDAVGAFRQWLRLTPEAVEPRLALAQALIRAGHRTEGRAELERARATDAGMMPATLALISLALEDKRTDDALALADGAAAKDPGVAARLRAGVESRTGAPDKAVATLTKALAERPSPALAADLFQARRAAGDKAGAAAGLREWLVGHPDDGRARFLLGTALMEERDYEGASVELGALLTVMPRDPTVLNNLAWVNHQLGRPDAVGLARRALALAPRAPEIADTLGWLLVEDGKAEDGVKLLRAAAAALPDDPAVRYHLAAALEATGDKAQARQVLSALLGDQRPFLERAKATELLQRLAEQ